MAFGASLHFAGDQPGVRPVLFGLQEYLFCVVTCHTAAGELVPGIHHVWRSAVSTGSPRFVCDVSITFTMAFGTAHAHTRVLECELLDGKVQVAHLATAVVCHVLNKRTILSSFIKQELSLTFFEAWAFLVRLFHMRGRRSNAGCRWWRGSRFIGGERGPHPTGDLQGGNDNQDENAACWCGPGSLLEQRPGLPCRGTTSLCRGASGSMGWSVDRDSFRANGLHGSSVPVTRGANRAASGSDLSIGRRHGD